MDVIAGYISTARISKNNEFYGLLHDGESHYYLEGTTYRSGKVPILVYDTDEKMLIKAYEKLIKEDARCTQLKYTEMPEIYKIPLNKFLGEVVEWVKIDDKHYFYTDGNIETVSIDEIKIHVR